MKAGNLMVSGPIPTLDSIHGPPTPTRGEMGTWHMDKKGLMVVYPIC